MTVPSVLPTVVCTRRGTARLCGVGVPAEMRALVMERTVCPNDNPACSCKPVVSIVGGVDGDGVEQALADYGGCVEMAFGKLLSGQNLLPTLERSGLYMALSTSTAYSVGPAHLFCNVLAKRFGLSDELRENMELAVHEAVVNGLLHGNLEISSIDRQTLDGFRKYCDQIERHLQDPLLGGRQIEVFAVPLEDAIELSVVDDGPGYETDNLNLGDDPERKSGRGLVLIRHFARQVAIEDGGRRLTMRFDR